MWNLTLFLSFLWVLSLLYGEWFAYVLPSHWTCSWPHSSLDGADYPSSHVKVAVITDPQLMDRTSLNLAPRSLALEMAQFYTDLYMRRAFFLSILPFNPDVILFLGDYFDGGWILSDEEWQESLGRFRHIFNLNTLQKNSNMKIYYLSGNHDIGYTAHHSRKPEIVGRHEREFGARNFKVKLGKVDFIAIDAQTVDGLPRGELTSATWNFIKNVSGLPRDELTSATWNFIKNVSGLPRGELTSATWNFIKNVSDNDSTPRVLLTHIPLYRSDWTPCGPHRSSPVINQRIHLTPLHQEIRYQNYITENATNILLDQIKPALVLSGHDHDQCTVTHMPKHGPVTEHTVGTVSWQQGNLYPSFMLLSVSNSTSSDEDPVASQLCFLPIQLYIYLWYLSLLAMTVVVILVWPANGVVISRKVGDLMKSMRSVFERVKEKNEDENCEYEEIWDAEGSMHLIKKTKQASSKSTDDRSSLGRGGNAVMRVRKQAEMEAKQDVSIHIGAVRTNKSKAKILIWRLMRGLRAIMVIAAINLPLYVLLIFKDWIDK